MKQTELELLQHIAQHLLKQGEKQVKKEDIPNSGENYSQPGEQGELNQIEGMNLQPTEPKKPEQVNEEHKQNVSKQNQSDRDKCRERCEKQRKLIRTEVGKYEQDSHDFIEEREAFERQKSRQAKMARVVGDDANKTSVDNAELRETGRQDLQQRVQKMPQETWPGEWQQLERVHSQGTVREESFQIVSKQPQVMVQGAAQVTEHDVSNKMLAEESQKIVQGGSEQLGREDEQAVVSSDLQRMAPKEQPAELRELEPDQLKKIVEQKPLQIEQAKVTGDESQGIIQGNSQMIEQGNLRKMLLCASEEMVVEELQDGEQHESWKAERGGLQKIRESQKIGEEELQHIAQEDSHEMEQGKVQGKLLCVVREVMQKDSQEREQEKPPQTNEEQLQELKEEEVQNIVQETSQEIEQGELQEKVQRAMQEIIWRDSQETEQEKVLQAQEVKEEEIQNIVQENSQEIRQGQIQGKQQREMQKIMQKDLQETEHGKLQQSGLQQLQETGEEGLLNIVRENSLEMEQEELQGKVQRAMQEIMRRDSQVTEHEKSQQVGQEQLQEIGEEELRKTDGMESQHIKQEASELREQDSSRIIVMKDELLEKLHGSMLEMAQKGIQGVSKQNESEKAFEQIRRTEELQQMHCLAQKEQKGQREKQLLRQIESQQMAIKQKLRETVRKQSQQNDADESRKKYIKNLSLHSSNKIQNEVTISSFYLELLNRTRE